MSRPGSRPTSRGHSSRAHLEHGKVSSKVFDCIVDESALIQGAKKSTRDGIPKWVAAGRIRLYVPLYTLDRITKLKGLNGRLASDAAEALEWLDGATSKYPEAITLQGGFEAFEKWEEVEEFAVSNTPFSGEGESTKIDSNSDLLAQTSSLTLAAKESGVGKSFSSFESAASTSTLASGSGPRSISPLSPPTSPLKAAANPLSLSATQQAASSPLGPTSSAATSESQIPPNVRPLIGYILWKVSQEKDSATALESFVLITDNVGMQTHASRFGIKTKTLAEVRYIVARENQDVRNRQILQQKSGTSTIANSKSSLKSENSRPSSSHGSTNGAKVAAQEVSDEDEILLRRVPKAPAALSKASHGSQQHVDGPKKPARSIKPDIPRPIPSSPRAVRASPARTGSHSRGQSWEMQTHRPATALIDPDSFARPSPRTTAARGTKGLWMPG